MFADFVADSDGSCWGVSSGELSEVNFPSSFVQDTAFVSVRHVVNNSQSDPFVVLCMGEDGKALEAHLENFRRYPANYSVAEKVSGAYANLGSCRPAGGYLLC